MLTKVLRWSVWHQMRLLICSRRRLERLRTLNSHPDILQLDEIAARESQVLPLALVTIGRAMAGKNRVQEWEQAIQMLKTYPSKFSGMGDHVYLLLKFSYDSLKNDTIKTCFLYLAVFQEDYEIMNDDLINLWIGEGFFHGFKNRTEPAGPTGSTVDRWTFRFGPFQWTVCGRTGIEPVKPTVEPSNRTNRPVFCKPVTP